MRSLSANSQWRRSRGGGDGPPNKNIPGLKYLFAPLKLWLNCQKLHQECTTNRHFEIQNQKISEKGDAPSPDLSLSGEGTPPPHIPPLSAPSAPRSPPKIYLDWRRCQQSYLYLVFHHPLTLFIPGLKLSFSANPSHCSPSFLLLTYSPVSYTHLTLPTILRV